MLGYELDFISCAIRDGFCKSSHKWFLSMSDDVYMTVCM